MTGCDTDDSAVVLTEFVASTVNLYAVPFVRPETEHEVAAGVGAVEDVEQPIPGMTMGNSTLVRPHGVTSDRGTAVRRRRPRDRDGLVPGCAARRAGVTGAPTGMAGADALQPQSRWRSLP